MVEDEAGGTEPVKQNATLTENLNTSNSGNDKMKSGFLPPIHSKGGLSGQQTPDGRDENHQNDGAPQSTGLGQSVEK